MKGKCAWCGRIYNGSIFSDFCSRRCKTQAWG